MDKDGLSLISLGTELLQQFRRNAQPLLLWEIVFKIAAALVLAPIFAVIGAYFISFTGHSSVSNEQLVDYFSSPAGLLSVLLWGILNLSLIFIEVAGLMTIAYSSVRGKAVSVYGTFTYTLRRIPVIFGIGTALFVFYALASLPFVAAAIVTYLWLLADFDISFYLIKRPPAFCMAAGIGIVLLCGMGVMSLYLVTSWLFALPVSLFERRGPLEAMRQSRALVRGSHFRIALILGISIAVFAGVSTAATSLAGGVAWFAAYGVGSLLERPALLGAIVLIANYLCSAVTSMVAFPLLGVLVVHLYIDRHRAIGLTPPNAPMDTGTQKTGEPHHSGFVRVAPWIVSAVIVVATGLVAMSVHSELEREDKVEVTAHRGSSAKAPENSLSAIVQAVQDGADYAEIDVQETADGVVVLLHDSDLMRVAAVGRKIWDVTYEEIASLDTGSWFSPKFSSERIATLERAIETAKGRIKLNIELKYNGHDRRLAEEVVEIVRKTGFVHDCVITSLNFEGLLKVRRLDGTIKTGHIVAKAIGDLFSSDVDVLSVESKLATADFIARTHDSKKEVHVWNLNDRKSMERFIDLRVNNIITDRPDLLVQILEARSHLSDLDRIIHKVESWTQ